jgi:NAD-dependent deacetylase
MSKVRMAAFTGAGISKASGIPTFEEMGNMREKLSRDYFYAHPQEFFDILKEFKRKSDQAQPNPAHKALAKYQVPVVTMNIDGLHRRAGSYDAIEVHGNLEYVFCEKCKDKYDYNVLDQSIRCPKCQSLLEPNVVLYGDMIFSYSKAIDCIASAQLLLVVGTSFFTSTTHMVELARNQGIQIKVINADAENEVPKFLKEIFEGKRIK